LVWGYYPYRQASLNPTGRANSDKINHKGGRVLDLQSGDFEKILAYLTGKTSPINNSNAITIMRLCKNFNQAKIPYSVPMNDA